MAIAVEPGRCFECHRTDEECADGQDCLRSAESLSICIVFGTRNPVNN